MRATAFEHEGAIFVGHAHFRCNKQYGCVSAVDYVYKNHRTAMEACALLGWTCKEIKYMYTNTKQELVKFCCCDTVTLWSGGGGLKLNVTMTL